MKQEHPAPREEYAGRISHEQTPQPLKYRLLDMFGLKEYLIDRFIFKPPSPQYSIETEAGELRVNTTPPTIYPPGYSQRTLMIEQEEHSIPAVILSLTQRHKYKGTLIYSHGNASDLNSALPFICKMAINFPCLDFVTYDYTGYGRSRKDSPTHQTVNRDLTVVIKKLRLHDSELILWGFSLGSYPTVKYATERQLKGVFLHSPLASLYSLLTYQNDTFSLIDQIEHINSFLVIIHSQEDEVVPFSHSKALFQRHRMCNSNVFCFLLEVKAYKHSELHSAITAVYENEVKEAVHKYLSMMIKKQVLSRAAQFQLSKQKYFENLGSVRGAEVLDVESRGKLAISQETDLGDVKNTSSLAQIKADHEFDFDDIEKENQVRLAIETKGQTGQYRKYFRESQSALEETVVSEVRDEDQIAQICK